MILSIPDQAALLDAIEATAEMFRRFWSKVSVSETGCWEWTAAKSRDGYGRFGIIGTQVKMAHHILIGFQYDPKTRIQCCHRCDNPGCVRPSHIFLGSDLDNALDRTEKGRGKFTRQAGTANGRSKLTDSQVSAIRSAPQTRGEVSRLARELGVSTATVSNIRSGKMWRKLHFVHDPKEDPRYYEEDEPEPCKHEPQAYTGWGADGKPTRKFRCIYCQTEL